jgi:hypothetical protein
VALTITDKSMRSDQTAHTARLEHFEAGDAWRVSWLPQRLMDRNAAITAMTLADLVSQGEGIGLHDDPRWPTVDALAAELGLTGPGAVVRIFEPGDNADTLPCQNQAAGPVPGVSNSPSDSEMQHPCREVAHEDQADRSIEVGP